MSACSLQCSKDHKVECDEQPEVHVDAAVTNDIDQNPVALNLSSGCRETLSIDAIISKPEILELLKKYPKLRNQLRNIYEATIAQHDMQQQSNRYEDRKSSHSNGRGYHKGSNHVQNQHWTHERVVDKGLEKLQWYLEANAVDSIGISEFCKTTTELRASRPQ
jgi:zinc finger HIT domain-containing protein 3